MLLLGRDTLALGAGREEVSSRGTEEERAFLVRLFPESEARAKLEAGRELVALEDGREELVVLEGGREELSALEDGRVVVVFFLRLEVRDRRLETEESESDSEEEKAGVKVDELESLELEGLRALLLFDPVERAASSAGVDCEVESLLPRVLEVFWEARVVRAGD